MNILISVVIPVYNAEPFLKEAIQSVIDQSYKNLEVIIINDGSNDNSLEILESFSESDKRIRLYSRPNLGLVSTLNEALSYCNGKYILRMDADDIVDAKWAETLYQFMEKNPQCDIVGTQGIAIDEKGKKQGSIRKPQSRKSINSHIIRNSPVIHPSVIMRKTIISEDFYRQSDWPAEDYGAWIRSNNGRNIRNVGEKLIYYRSTDNGISNTNNQMQKEKATEVREKYLLNSFLKHSTERELQFLTHHTGFIGMISLWIKNPSDLSLSKLALNYLLSSLRNKQAL